MANYRDEFLADTYYLVENQGFNNNVLFEKSDDYKTFILYVIANLLEHPGLVISAYCILPKSFQLVILNKEKGLKLSNFMRKVQVSYAMYFKKNNMEKEQLKGVPVFDGRFKAKAIKENKLEYVESCVALEAINNKFVEDVQNWPYTSAHQIADTGYNYMTQTHIKIYNDGRKLDTSARFKELEAVN